MDVFVTAAFADLHRQHGPQYSDIGRPSIDPEVMLCMLVDGYCYGIRSEHDALEDLTQDIAVAEATQPVS